METVRNLEANKLRQNRHLYDYDAEAETHKQWPELSRIVAQELKEGKITPLC
jgi:hypothetical protein